MRFQAFKFFSHVIRSQNFLYGGIILLTALAVYSGGLNNDFLVNWDDPEYVTDNPAIQAFTLTNIYKIFTSLYLGAYSPVHVLSYMFDYSLWGLNPTGFFLVNVLLHGLNALLFFRILCRLGFPAPGALLVALLFTVHPVQVENVAWISQRKSVLSLTFFLAAFWQYLSYAEGDEREWRHYILSLAFFLLALLTKMAVVILPAILLSYDFLLRARQRRFWAMAVEKLPFAIIGLAVVWHAVTDKGNTAPALVGGSISSEVMTMLTVYQKYLFNLAWPLQLSAEYQVDIKRAIDLKVASAALLMALSLASVLLVRRGQRRGAAFCLAVFLIGFLPVSQIIPFIHLMYDRYLYMPMLGLAAGLGLVLNDYAERFEAFKKPLYIAALVVLLLLGSLSWQRTTVWANSLTLWQDAVVKEPRAAQAWEGLGQSFGNYGDYRQALANYQRALTLAPSSAEILFKMGSAFLDAGEFSAAVQPLCKSLELNPDNDKALYNLGYAYMLTGQHEDAIKALERGIRRDPQGLDILVFMGASYYALGELQSAWRVYEQVRESQPQGESSLMASGVLALIALRQGDEEKSNRLWQETVASGATDAEIYLNWARLEALRQHHNEALHFIAKAISAGAVNLSSLFNDPIFWRLRGDPQFIRMVTP